jgi:hypothetical protein
MVLVEFWGRRFVGLGPVCLLCSRCALLLLLVILTFTSPITSRLWFTARVYCSATNAHTRRGRRLFYITALERAFVPSGVIMQTHEKWHKSLLQNLWLFSARFCVRNVYVSLVYIACVLRFFFRKTWQDLIYNALSDCFSIILFFLLVCNSLLWLWCLKSEKTKRRGE